MDYTEALREYIRASTNPEVDELQRVFLDNLLEFVIDDGTDSILFVISPVLNFFIPVDSCFSKYLLG